MRDGIARRESEAGLACMLADYGYRWISKNDSTAYDVEIGDFRMRWNGAARGRINSARSAVEMASIHTLHGYDLNYAGGIIGPEVRWNAAASRIRIDRANHFEARARRTAQCAASS